MSVKRATANRSICFAANIRRNALQLLHPTLAAFAMICLALAGTAHAEGSSDTQKEWIQDISSKVRSNLALPGKVPEDIRVEFYVELLPDGSVASVRRKSSSGSSIFDDATERAIFRSSPFPRPRDPKDFTKQLVLVFMPGM